MNQNDNSMGVIIYIALLIGVVLLQIKLSKAESKWPGLVLPAISIIMAVMMVMGAVSFGTLKTSEIRTYDDAGNLIGVEQTNTKPEQVESEGLFTSIYIFFLGNIPTIVLLGIYFGYRGKRKRQAAVNKMSIQDL